MQTPSDKESVENSTEADANAPPRHGLLHLGHPDGHIPGYEVPDVVAAAPTRGRLWFGLSVAMLAAVGGFWLEHLSHGAAEATVALPWVTPFVLLLTSIAAMPFLARRWWEHNYARVSFALAAIIVVYYLARVPDGPLNVARAAAEYVSFIFLLGSLFIVSGGILIRVRARATPAVNTSLLLIGAILANVFGTTGAAMLLIRPFLRMNRGHLRPYHVVFFIFVVANAGGSLTPIGDPPLFLGYLKGVPFFWVLDHCWPIWCVAVGALLTAFFVFDFIQTRKQPRRTDDDDLGPAVSVYGGMNLLLVFAILAGILLHAPINALTHARFHFEAPWRELIMAGAAAISLAFTPRRIHAENTFNYAPIKEVAFLFIGIFMTMIPALNYLYHASASGGGLLHSPAQYYFTCGSLSSVLDNAPTYLTFLKTEMGTLDPAVVERSLAIAKRDGHDVTAADLANLSHDQQAQLRRTVAALVEYHGDRVDRGTLSDDEVRIGVLVGDPILNQYLIAISMGAVLFGAFTYIGNGPNFMVKSIAEHAGAETPGFFAYIYKFSVPILLPILLLIWLVFLR